VADRDAGHLPGLARHAIAAIRDELADLALDLIDPTCKELAEELRERCPGVVPVRLPPGATAPPVSVGSAHSAALYATAFAAATQLPATAPSGSAVVWADGEHEVLIHPGRVRVLFRDGFVLVGMTVFTEQTGTVEITVPFAVGTAAEPAGLMIATEPVPRGPALVVERWGDQLIAAAWQALVHLAGGIAASAGSDTAGAPLIPVALTASAAGLTVLPQATPPVTAAGPLPAGPPPAGTGPAGEQP
jgi:hypothetical protein